MMLLTNAIELALPELYSGEYTPTDLLSGCRVVRHIHAELTEDGVEITTPGEPRAPSCGHSACSQNYIDTDDHGCVADELPAVAT